MLLSLTWSQLEGHAPLLVLTPSPGRCKCWQQRCVLLVELLINKNQLEEIVEMSLRVIKMRSGDHCQLQRAENESFRSEKLSSSHLSERDSSKFPLNQMRPSLCRILHVCKAKMTLVGLGGFGCFWWF